MNAHGSWLLKGYFILGDDQPSFTQAVRQGLCGALGLPPSGLEIVGYPSHQAWRHTVYWREGDTSYAEAQFFARIAKESPVLSLGVSVEKGLEHQSASGDEAMVRRAWDWARFVAQAANLMATDAPAIAVRLARPLSLHISVNRHVESANEPDREVRVFSYVDGQWFERHVGTSDAAAIAAYVAEIDRREGSWAVVYLGCHLSPAEADRLSPSATAEILAAFEPFRRRLRPQRTPGGREV